MSKTIGELARTAGSNVETVRYYERIGLLPKPERSNGNYRLYEEAHVRRLQFIRRARELGFHLDTVRALLRVSDQPDISCSTVDQLTRDQIVEVERKISDLSRLRDELRQLANQCEGGTIAQCRIIDALSPASVAK